MQIEKAKEKDNSGKSLFREILSWVVSACSILWLTSIWNAYLKTPNDKQVFLITVLIYIPIWIAHTIVRNRGERYKRLSDIIAIIAIYPPFIFYTWLYFTNPKSAMHDTVELILFIAFFGVFWELGRKIKEFNIVLFRN